MTPAQSYAIADEQCRRHAAGCRHCGPPDPSRETGGCPTGRLLSRAWAGAWLRRIHDMTGDAVLDQHRRAETTKEES